MPAVQNAGARERLLLEVLHPAGAPGAGEPGSTRVEREAEGGDDEQVGHDRRDEPGADEAQDRGSERQLEAHATMVAEQTAARQRRLDLSIAPCSDSSQILDVEVAPETTSTFALPAS